MNSKTRSNRSICEKSMKLVTNIVKVSYISIAKIGLRTGAPPRPHATHNLRAVMTAPSLPRYPRNFRSQEPINSSKPVYLIHPGDGNRSSLSMINEEESVDGNASDYIRKVRERHLKDANEMTNLSEFIMPPPPHVMLRSSSSY